MKNAYTVRRTLGGRAIWHKIGVAFPCRGDGGMKIQLDSIPIPDENGEVNIFLFDNRPRRY